MWWWWFSRQVVSDSCNPMDCSPPGSSVHGVLQARTLTLVAIPFSRGSSGHRNQTRVSCTAGRRFTSWALREAHLWWSVIVSPSWPGQWLKPDLHPLRVTDCRPHTEPPFLFLLPAIAGCTIHPQTSRMLWVVMKPHSLFRKQPKLQHQGVKPSRALSSVAWWQAANAATLLSSACMQSGSEMPASLSRSIHPKTLWQFSWNLVTQIWRWEHHSIPHVAKTPPINEAGMSCLLKSHACFIQDVWGGGRGSRRG